MVCIEHDWKEFIKEFHSWEPLYDIFGLYNSRGRVGQIKGITFEIRSKEAVPVRLMSTRAMKIKTFQFLFLILVC